MNTNNIDNMNINFSEIAQNLTDKLDEALKNLPPINMIIAGKSGVGKSTLINAMFRDELAETGTGFPVTSRIRKYTKRDVPLTIYDTPGLELTSDQQIKVKQEIMEIIDDSSIDKKTQIHCIMYCINSLSERIEPAEIEWIKELSKTDIPIIIVLTKVNAPKKAERLKRVIEGENLKAQCVSVLAKDDDDYDPPIKSHGLDRLLELLCLAIPEELYTTLNNVQIISVSEKQKAARQVVWKYCVGAGICGVAPIPFSDFLALIPTQLTMLVHITIIFGLDINKSKLLLLITSTLGCGSSTMIGKAFFSNLLKLIPGAGTIAGGAVSAGTAALVTGALGEAYIQLLSKFIQGEINELGAKQFNDLYMKQLRIEMNKQ